MPERKLRIRRLVVVSATSLLAAGSFIFALGFGAAEIPASQVLAILGHSLGGDIAVTWPAWAENIVFDIRLPRVVLAALVGAALSLSGATLQGIFRNPLASPSVLGVSAGASFGAVIAIYLGLAAVWVWSIPLMALLGGAGVTFAVYAIAGRQGRTPIGSLLLAGIALGGLASALSAFVLSMELSRWKVASTILFWTMGGLEGRSWDHVLLAAPLILFGSLAMLAHSRDLDALSLGEVHAASVGVDVASVRKRLILASSMATAAAVGVAGGIGFVGLIVPHIIRLLIGPHHRWLLVNTIIGGAGFLVLVDLLIRVLFVHRQLPIGVVTAALGAPFFLFLLVRNREFRF